MTQVLENLDEDEAYLFAILSDPSGLDQAEFLWVDHSSEDNKFCPKCGTARDGVHLEAHGDVEPGEWVEKYTSPSGCFRAWPYQWPWWRDRASLSIDQCARSVGKSLSIKVRGCSFPWLFPGQEMVITAPELVHLEPIVSLIESQVHSTRTLRELLPSGKSAVTHRPFQMNFVNGARIIGRIPQRDGKGVKGCSTASELVFTDEGYRRADEIRVGDLVLTHEGRYQPVTAVYEDVNDCYEVKGQSSFPMTVSCDHRFYGAENTATPKQKRNLLPLAWHDVEFLTEHQVYWATPTEFPALPVPWPEAPFELRSSLANFWWLVGRYLADGIVAGRRVEWFVPPAKRSAIEAVFNELGVHYNVVDRDHSAAAAVTVYCTSLGRWLVEHFGKLAGGKKLPAWALGMERVYRQALLDGYLAGDGWFNEHKKRYEVGTASKILAVGIQMLAQSLGYTVNCTSVRPKVTHICGTELKTEPQVSWRLQIGYGHPVEIGDYLVGKVKSVEPAGKQTVYDIRIEGDHSYLTGSIMSHNIHPIWLELDEAQDYPHAGWIELNETLKRGFTGSMWRAHGVTKGVRDDFYEITQDTPDNRWKVHRFAAMWRPNWTDTEREEAIQKYGSREDPDYRRNVLGLHGDKTNPIFVLTQLMKNVDSEPLSDYNSGEYFKQVIKSEQLEMFRQDITEVLDFPAGHKAYTGNPRQRAEQPQAYYWIGMDVGFTIDPSEILVFVEHRPKGKSGTTQLRLLSRLSLVRMPHREQIKAILHTIDYYRPRAFSMDKGGLGLPLFQEIQEHLDAFKARDMDRLPAWMHTYDLQAALVTIKGYNFSEKLLVDIDKSVELSPYDDQEDIASKAGLRRNAKEYSTDVLREMVDRQQLWLPWDDDLLKQFQGGTWSSNRSMDAYGRRTFSQGNDHCVAEGTPVATPEGERPIEEIVAGDQVLTRGGPRRVLRAWQTSPEAEVLTISTDAGQAVTLTPDHPVLTPRGWILAGEVSMGDQVITWAPQSSSSMASSSTGTRTHLTGPTAPTSLPTLQTAYVESGASTRKSGWTATAPSRTATTSTTSTTTRSTTSQTIWRPSPPPNIEPITLPEHASATARGSGSPTWNGSGHSQPNGTGLSKDGPGTASTAAKSPTGSRWSLPSATSAGTATSPSGPAASARPPVSNGGLTTMDRRSTVSVPSVATPTCAVPSSRVATAPARVVDVLRHERGVAVYDLTVETDHEFIAGGIVVHNCLDAARMMALGWAQHSIEEMMRKPAQQPVLDVAISF